MVEAGRHVVHVMLALRVRVLEVNIVRFVGGALRVLEAAS